MAVDPKRMWSALVAYLQSPTDLAGLAAFRILFGLMMCFGSLRFLWNGWVERFFVQPDYFFSYWGFEWVSVLPGTGMTVV
ncbi:MAG TPA: HTTM domain-containing protein, partial [Gammaproteobacteria bacterium]|nr:HTTM domain-containing protein [Gammaproteobacteria bacterium]